MGQEKSQRIPRYPALETKEEGKPTFEVRNTKREHRLGEI